MKYLSDSTEAIEAADYVSHARLSGGAAVIEDPYAEHEQQRLWIPGSVDDELNFGRLHVDKVHQRGRHAGLRVQTRVGRQKTREDGQFAGRRDARGVSG